VYLGWALLLFWIWYFRAPILKGLRRTNKAVRGVIPGWSSF
jgi:hypothetical protein